MNNSESKNMQLVILAGGLGTRMREETEFVPKPMVRIGNMPVLLHIMKWYSKFGVTRFVIAGGYKMEVIREYFAQFPATASDFRVMDGRVETLGPEDYRDWEIIVADSGNETETGGRLLRVRKYLEGSDFLCTYGDGLSNVDIGRLLEHHRMQKKTATITVAQPSTRFGVVKLNNGMVESFSEKPKSNDFVNIGHFVFENSLFDHLTVDEPLEKGPLINLARQSELSAFEHDGFFEPMDTFREFLSLNKLWNSGQAPWM